MEDARSRLINYHRNTTEKMHDILKRKNADYSGTNPDPFFNFTKVEILGIASTEQGFLTRMNDKFSRVITFVQKGSLQVADETVEDTLIDLANYSLLMAAYLREKRYGRHQDSDIRPENGEHTICRTIEGRIPEGADCAIKLPKEMLAKVKSDFYCNTTGKGTGKRK